MLNAFTFTYLLQATSLIFAYIAPNLSPEDISRDQRNYLCCKNNLPCCNAESPHIQIRAILAKCKIDTKCENPDNTDAQTKDQANEEDDQAFRSKVTACKKKILITMKIESRGKVSPKTQFVVIDHVYDPSTEKTEKLFHPYVIKMKLEHVSQTYGMKFVNYVNSEAKEVVFNKHDGNYTGCRTDLKNNPTCGLVTYNGKIIPYCQGFCCSCDNQKNIKNQPQTGISDSVDSETSFADPAHLLDGFECPPDTKTGPDHDFEKRSHFINFKSREKFGHEKIGQDNFGREKFERNNIGRENFGRENFDRENLARENLGQHNLARENLGQHNLAREHLAQDNLAQDNLAQDNLAQDNLAQDNLAQANLAQDNLAQDNLGRDNLARENFDRDDLVRGNFARDTLARDNLARDNLARDNLARDNLARDNLARDNLARDNLSQGNLARSNLAQDNLARDNLAQDNFARESFGKKNLKRNLARETFGRENFDRDSFGKQTLARENFGGENSARESFGRQKRSNIRDRFNKIIFKREEGDFTRGTNSKCNGKNQILSGGVQIRGGQNCADRYTPPGMDPEKYHESTHCLRFSDLWYGIYQLQEPVLDHEFTLRMYEKQQNEMGQTVWRDLNEGKNVELGTFNRFFVNDKKTISFYYKPHSSNVKKVDYSLNYKTTRILIPEETDNTDKARFPELRGGPSEYLVLRSDKINLEGDQCNIPGVGFEAFFKQPNRCSVPKGSCLANQPKHLWLHDYSACKSGRKGCFFLKNFANVPDNALKKNASSGEVFLRLEYLGRFVTTVDIEVAADSNIVLKQHASAAITEVYTDSTCPSKTMLTAKVTNTGLISGKFMIRLSDCSTNDPHTFSSVETDPVLIPPQHQHVFNLELKCQLPSEILHCSVEVLNFKKDLLALRRTKIQKSDRCICSWYCACACIGTAKGLKCVPMSLDHYHAAGFQGGLPIETTVIHSSRLNDLFSLAFYVILFIVLTLLLLGLTKAILGLCCCPAVGMWGLPVLLDIPDRDYCSPSQGNEKPMRSTSRTAEFCINVVFFFTFPIVVFLLVCRKICCQVYTYRQSEKTSTTNDCACDEYESEKMVSFWKYDEDGNEEYTDEGNYEDSDGKHGSDNKYGSDGKRGSDGKHGSDGKRGSDGKHGSEGKIRKVGKQGNDRERGNDGKHGKDGKYGNNGKDKNDGKNGNDGGIYESDNSKSDSDDEAFRKVDENYDSGDGKYGTDDEKYEKKREDFEKESDGKMDTTDEDQNRNKSKKAIKKKNPSVVCLCDPTSRRGGRRASYSTPESTSSHPNSK